MRSGVATIIIIFRKNKLTKLANFVQFIRMLMFCLKWEGGGWAPLGHDTVQEHLSS